MKRKDAELYRKLSKPFENVEIANESIKAFFDEVYALREKYYIREAHVIVCGEYVTSDGETEAQYVTDFHAGDEFQAERMLAWASGRAAKERQEMLGRLMTADVLLRTGGKP